MFRKDVTLRDDQSFSTPLRDVQKTVLIAFATVFVLGTMGPNANAFKQGWYGHFENPLEVNEIGEQLRKSNFVIEFSDKLSISLVSWSRHKRYRDLTETQAREILERDKRKQFLAILFSNHIKQPSIKAFEPDLIDIAKDDLRRESSFIDSLGYSRCLILTTGHSNTRTGWFVLEDRIHVRK